MSLELVQEIREIKLRLDILQGIEVPAVSATTDIGARVYNSTSITLSNATMTTLTFDSERWDTDSIHSTVSNTSRLTCQTAGKYVIVGNVRWTANATGYRGLRIRTNGLTGIAEIQTPAEATGAVTSLSLTTIADLAVADYVELQAIQTSGGDLAVVASTQVSPEFAMHRI